jgi:hypothetical protein
MFFLGKLLVIAPATKKHACDGRNQPDPFVLTEFPVALEHFDGPASQLERPFAPFACCLSGRFVSGYFRFRKEQLSIRSTKILAIASGI